MFDVNVKLNMPNADKTQYVRIRLEKTHFLA